MGRADPGLSMDVGLLSFRCHALHDAIEDLVRALQDHDDETVNAALAHMVDCWCSLGKQLVAEYGQVEP